MSRTTTANPKLDTAPAIAALAACIKDKAAKEAKAALPEGSTHEVSLLVALDAVVSKTSSTPATQSERPAVVQLLTCEIVAAALERMSIDMATFTAAVHDLVGRLRSKQSVEQVGRGPSADALRAALEEEARRLAARLPAEPCTVPGQSARVSVAVQSLRFLPPELLSCAGTATRRAA